MKGWKFIVSICTAVVLIAAAGWALLLRPHLLYSRTVEGNMTAIRFGVIQFANEEGRLPKDLGEVVSGGYLPRNGGVYANYMLHDDLSYRELSFQECEFSLQFSDESFEIWLPAKVVSDFDLKSDSLMRVLREDVVLK